MLTSAAGILANLKDDRQDLKGRVMLTRFAQKKLDQIEVVQGQGHPTGKGAS